jgi:hypothetical protein
MDWFHIPVDLSLSMADELVNGLWDNLDCWFAAAG